MSKISWLNQSDTVCVQELIHIKKHWFHVTDLFESWLNICYCLAEGHRMYGFLKPCKMLSYLFNDWYFIAINNLINFFTRDRRMREIKTSTSASLVEIQQTFKWDSDLELLSSLFSSWNPERIVMGWEEAHCIATKCVPEEPLQLVYHQFH